MSEARKEFSRHYCAIVTPYRQGTLEVDYEAFERHLRYFVDDEDFRVAGGALIVNSEAGEMFYLTEEERGRLLEIAMDLRPEGMPVFAGIFGVSKPDVIAAVEQAVALGADGLFVLPPTGTLEVSTAMNGARNPEIWTDHMRRVADVSDLPLIIHAHHAYTREWGFGFPAEAVRMVLEAVPTLVGWKLIHHNASAHFRIAKLIRSLREDVALLNAPPQCYHTALLCDLIDGSVRGAYNYNKEPLIRHELAWDAGDLNAVRDAWCGQAMPLEEFVYADVSRLHIRYKIATWLRGHISHPFMRPPMPPPRWTEVEALHDLIGRAGLSRIGEASLKQVWDTRDDVLASY